MMPPPSSRLNQCNYTDTDQQLAGTHKQLLHFSAQTRPLERCPSSPADSPAFPLLRHSPS